LSIQLNKLTGLVLLCLAFFSSGLVAQENKYSLSSYGNQLSSEQDKFFYFDELEGVLFLDGDIEKGMYTNFRQAITENKIHTIVLSSLGGNVEEGLNIAGTVFDKGIKTYIPKGYECYSACSFIFFAGSEKYALGKLGVHQAAYADDISKEKIAVGVVKTISQISTADILLRLGEFNTPRFVEQRMLRTAPEDMYIFNQTELNKLGNLDVSNNSKALFKNIDNFIDELQLHYAELDCDNDETKCSPSQLCSRAASNKSWLTTIESQKYVIAAKGKGLSCKVPTPLCPEDIKKCNKEYLCTKGTTGVDIGKSWVKNSFAEEAKNRGYLCGIMNKDHPCYKNPQQCSIKELCSVATATKNNGERIWDLSEYFYYGHIKEAQARNLSCDVDPQLEINKCYEDPKHCSDVKICKISTQETIIGKVWKPYIVWKRYVSEAKKRDLTCGTRQNPEIEKDTCKQDYRKCTYTELCQVATKGSGASKKWQTDIKYKQHVNTAKKTPYYCGVKVNKIPSKLTCTSDAKNCSIQQLCERATSDLNGVRVWDDRNDFISYALEAKKRFLNCGIYEKFNLAFPNFTEYGESNNEINDRIRILIKDKLLGTQSFNEIIVNNDLNRSFNMPIDYSGWQKLGTNFLITGSINVKGDDLSFKYRLFDILHEKSFGKIINFDIKVQDLDEMSNQASDNIKKQFSEHLNSSNRHDTIKIIQEELLKAGCKIGMADGVIGTRTRTALKEITQKLKINYSDSLASTPSYMFNLLKIIKSTDVSKYWCSSDSSELQNYEEGMQLLFKNDFSLAILKLGKFIEASSNTVMLAKAHYYIGDAFTGLKDWKLALKSYLKSFELETDGDYAAKALKASYLTALMPLNENNFELAIIQFDSLIDVIPNGPLLTAAHYSKGDALSKLEDWKSAGQSYLESFRLEPDGKYAAKALMNVGVSLGKMQKINEACNILSRVELRFPKSEVVKEAKYEMQLFGCS